jgi:hypothetical protein
MRDRQWQRPQLLVLARSNPEEAVLTACKTQGDMPNVADTTAKGCFCMEGDFALECVPCHNIADS